jgi:hypothetical protein
MTEKERLKYESKYRHLNLYFAHGPGWDELTLAGAQILDARWPNIPFWLKHLWNWALPGNYKMTKLEVFLQRIHLLKYINNPPYKFTQIKEKFGGLCLYTLYYLPIINAIEDASYHRCEFCGTNQNIGRTQGWVKTCCESCAKTYCENRGKGLTWKKLKVN